MIGGEITKKLVHERETKDISVLRWWKDNKGGELDIGGDMTKERVQLKSWAHK